ncbi:MAG: hypothetical protein IPN42_01865 [Methylococcaceae bacterium]|nr:hypothetical protein [Methylococcaceae bacterium]
MRPTRAPMAHAGEVPAKSLGASADTLRISIFNEAEPMPLTWTSHTTGSIYPAGVIPEKPGL